MYQVSTRVTKYTVTAAPPNDEEAGHWEITVEERGPDSWAVCHFGECMDNEGNWTHERQPSSRSDTWKSKNRFALAEAIRLAEKAAPFITVNGFGVEHLWFRAANGRLPTWEELPLVRKFDWNRIIPNEVN